MASLFAGYVASIGRGRLPKVSTVTAACTYALKHSVSIQFDFVNRIVELHGLKLRISEFKESEDGVITLRAQTAAHDLFAVITDTASVRFRIIPGNFEELVCEQLVREEMR